MANREWITTSVQEINHWLHREESDFCPHIEELPEMAVAVLCEDDSSGPVCRRVVCKECLDVAEADRLAERVQCYDCKEQKSRAQVYQWKPWDFSWVQGDEPLEICEECWTAPRHERRLARDDADRQAF